MRAGVVCSGAIAVAAIATASLIQIDAFGSAKPEAATQTAAAPTIRRVDTAPPASPQQAEQPQTIAATEPVNALGGGDSTPPMRVVATSVETTGSIAPIQKLYVNGSRVALRSAPESSAKIVDRMSDGQKLIEMSRNGEWVRVRFANSNAEGWVNSSLVSSSPARRK